MPFTVSHAAAALPFRRLRPIWPALVIGTLAPDFEYFLRLSDEDRMGHHLPGLLIVTLPLAVLAFWLFESYIREPIVELLPGGLQRRLPDVKRQSWFGRWDRFAAVVVWITVGIATHIVWDWFTHSHTWIWENWDWLEEYVAVPYHAPVMVAKLVQYASSLLGLAVLIVWFAFWYCRANPARAVTTSGFSLRRKITIVGSVAGIALAACYPLAVTRLSYLYQATSFVALVGTMVEAVILLVVVQVLLYGIVRTYQLRCKPLPIRVVQQRRDRQQTSQQVGDLSETDAARLSAKDCSQVTPRS